MNLFIYTNKGNHLEGENVLTLASAPASKKAPPKWGGASVELVGGYILPGLGVLPVVFD